MFAMVTLQRTVHRAVQTACRGTWGAMCGCLGAWRSWHHNFFNVSILTSCCVLNSVSPFPHLGRNITTNTVCTQRLKSFLSFSIPYEGQVARYAQLNVLPREETIDNQIWGLWFWRMTYGGGVWIPEAHGVHQETSKHKRKVSFHINVPRTTCLRL